MPGDTPETDETSFHRGVLRALTNSSFAGDAHVSKALRWWCDAERFNCRHAFLRLTRGLFWFGHKLPKQWLAPELELRARQPASARCAPPAQRFELVTAGAECCTKDGGGQPQTAGHARRMRSQLLYHTEHGYTDTPGGCEGLCTRMNCSFFSFTSEWHKCTLCDGHECPFAHPSHRTRWSNRSTVYVRVASTHYLRSASWRAMYKAVSTG